MHNRDPPIDLLSFMLNSCPQFPWIGNLRAILMVDVESLLVTFSQSFKKPCVLWSVADVILQETPLMVKDDDNH